jgi:hypothetical protein
MAPSTDVFTVIGNLKWHVTGVGFLAISGMYGFMLPILKVTSDGLNSVR